VRWNDLFLIGAIDSNDGASIDFSVSNTLNLVATDVQVNGVTVEDNLKKVGTNYVTSDAGSSITTALNNVLLGTNAGNALDSNSSIAIGNSALQNATGGLNIGIGVSSFNALTTATNCVGIGHNVGMTIVNGSLNTLIGSSSDTSGGAVANSIALGAFAVSDTSRHCVIGRPTGNTITAIKPGANGDCDLGIAACKFKDLYLDNTITNNDGSVIDLSTTDCIDLQAATTQTTSDMLVGGDCRVDSNDFTGGAPVNFGIFTETADVQIADTLTETSMLGGGEGTKTIPANFLKIGDTFHLEMSGYMDTVATPDATIRVKLGATTISSHTISLATIPADEFWDLHMCFVVRTTGASGTVTSSGKFEYMDSGTLKGIGLVATGTTTINTTIAETIDITWEWGTAAATNDIVVQQAHISTHFHGDTVSLAEMSKLKNIKEKTEKEELPASIIQVELSSENDWNVV
jgi:hypothetical protein